MRVAMLPTWLGQVESPKLDGIQEEGSRLLGEYWDDISKYLQHCTETRYQQAHDWPVGQMHREIESVVSAYKEIVRPWRTT